MYAVIQDRNRQHTVRSGDVILCDTHADKTPGEKITFEHVLLVGGEGASRIGKPFVEGASVTAEVLGVVRGEKLVIFHMKRRKNMRRKRGHRQDYTRVRIQDITG
jgi:large subunit ribosomal protein L21